MKTKRTGAKLVWNIVSGILIAIMVVLVVMLVGVRLIGYQPYCVLSGSMEPTYRTGSLIYVKKADPQDIKVGDPITFVLDENLTVATHRVIEIDEADRHFYTKGDANEYPDASPVHFNNLIGRPSFTIPYMGYVTNYIQNPPGRYIAIAAAAVILLLIFITDLFDDSKKKGKGKGKGVGNVSGGSGSGSDSGVSTTPRAGVEGAGDDAGKAEVKRRQPVSGR